MAIMVVVTEGITKVTTRVEAMEEMAMKTMAIVSVFFC